MKPERPAPRLILVVDDNELEREIAATALRHAGHVVLEAKNGNDAVAVIATSRPDLVLLDLQMPELDGLELLRLLRLAPSTADIPVIVLTNYVDMLRQAPPPRIEVVIEKPFGPTALINVVDQLFKDIEEQEAP